MYKTYIALWFIIGVFLVFEALYIQLKGVPQSKTTMLVFTLLKALLGIYFIVSAILVLYFQFIDGDIWYEWT